MKPLLLGLLAVCCFARELAPGNPPLTTEMAAKAASFFEWALDVHFTPAQQEEYGRLLASDWPDAGKRATAQQLIQNVDKLSSVPEAKKRQVHDQIKSSLVEEMRKGSEEGSRWMYAIYTAAHGESAPDPISTPKYPALSAGQLVGTWRESKAAAVQYKDSRTGSMAPTSGNSFTYVFNADGTYSFTGLMQVTTYGCTSSIFHTMAGKYHTESDILVLDPTSGNFKTQGNCGMSNQDKPADLTRSELRIHFEQDSIAGKQLVATDKAGTTRPDYFRQVRQ